MLLLIPPSLLLRGLLRQIMYLRRAPYLLFEVMIGLILVALFASFIFPAPGKQIRSQQERLVELEAARLFEDMLPEALTHASELSFSMLCDDEKKVKWQTLKPVPTTFGPAQRSFSVVSKTSNEQKKYKKLLITCVVQIGEYQKKTSPKYHAVAYAKTTDAS